MWAVRHPTMLMVLVTGLVSLTSGCASSGSRNLADIQLDRVRTLAARCYIENREVLTASYSPEVRLACREWAERQAGIGI